MFIYGIFEDFGYRAILRNLCKHCSLIDDYLRQDLLANRSASFARFTKTNATVRRLWLASKSVKIFWLAAGLLLLGQY